MSASFRGVRSDVVEHTTNPLDGALVREFRRDGVAGARIVNSTRALSQELDPAAAVARIARAERERCVSVRLAPEGMSWVTALLPMRDGVATHAALLRAAQHPVGGDERTRSQVMADPFFAGLTGRNPLAEPVAVAVNLVMTEEALLRGGEWHVVHLRWNPADHAPRDTRVTAAPATSRALRRDRVHTTGGAGRTASGPPRPPGTAHTAPNRRFNATRNTAP